MTVSAAKLALAIKRLRAEGSGLEMLDREPIAIIGMACRFPGGAESPEKLWRLLEQGHDAVREVPEERWGDCGLAKNGRLGGFLPEIDRFDPEFFGIAPREADYMDPQQRLLLEVAWEGLWDAGIAPETLAGTDTGVFAAVYSSDYSRLQFGQRGRITAHTSSGTASSVAAGRISFLLDLRGPSLAVDTACSSSLSAVHLACQSLRRRESDTAIAGGCSLKVLPDEVESFIKLGMVASDGRCKAFDQQADGFGIGEGCGVIVLRRLTDALANGDRVLAVIRGSAMNQDGRSSALTAPNGLAQRAVLLEAIENAQVEPGDIGYIEAHGTGTALGDPIEMEALGEVLGRGGRPCFVSSVKTNIGHLEAAAGVAGVIKTVLCLQHERIPRHLHFTGLNPQITLEGTRLAIPVGSADWRRDSSPRLAGVSSFGFSGTNVHVIVEEAPVLPRQKREDDRSVRVLPLSARSEKALQELAGAFAESISDPLLDVCYTAGACRSHYEERAAVVASPASEMAEELRKYAAGQRSAGVITGRKPHGSLPGLVFVFSGQGTQWAGMGRELIESSAVFRTAIEECSALLAPMAGWALTEKLHDAGELERTEVAQPAIFAIQVALVNLWRHWGVAPDAVIGHSVGEIAAAYAAGVLSLGEAARVVFHRSRLMHGVAGLGKMAAVRSTVAEAEREIEGDHDRLSIAAMNAAQSVVISGESAALEEVLGRLNARGVRVQPLGVNYAFHSPQMNPLREELVRALGAVKISAGAIPVYSTVSGGRASGGDFGAQYWARNMREPVRLQQAVEASMDAGCRTFVEIGPHAVLSSPLSECADARRVQVNVLASMRRQGGLDVMLRSAGSLYCEGRTLDWQRMYAGGEQVSLPTYPWQRQRYWVPAVPKRESRGGAFQPHQVVSPAIRGRVFEFDLNADVAFLRGHRVHGELIVPFTGYMHMLREAGVTALENLVVSEPLRVAEDAQVKVQVVIEGDRFEIHRLAGESWTKHADGRLAGAGAASGVEHLAAGTPLNVDQLYERLLAKGVAYGDEYRVVKELMRDGERAAGRIEIDETGPAALDGCLQPVWGAIGLEGDTLYVPTIAGSAGFFGELKGEVWSYATVTARTASGITADIHVRNAACEAVLEIRDLHLRRIEPKTASASELIYGVVWREAARQQEVSGPPDDCLVIAGDRDFEEYEQILCGRDWRAVVYVASREIEIYCRTTVRIVQALARMERPPRLWLMTHGDLEQSPIWGFARTIALEHPELRCSVVELDESAHSEFAKEVAADTAEPFIVLRGDKRYVGRLEQRRKRQEPASLTISSPGVLENLTIGACERRDPGAGEIEIRVLATGLNFRDVLAALGMYPGEVRSFGAECAGVVERVGTGVSAWKPGDEVMAFAQGSFGTFVTAPVECAAHKPAELTFVQAAGMPVAFLTAKYGLQRLARMKSGDRVLIHAATGGVGLAAVQLAQRAGAEVYTTAGNEHKRDYLRKLGVKHVFDSRSIAFARDLQVDIVLNSLTGDFIPAGLSALAKGGRFIELGKRGIWTDEQVRSVRPDVEYFAFDLAEVAATNPGVMREMFDELLSSGLQPLPVAIHEFDKAADAFRTMSQARHIGKLVVMHSNWALGRSAAVRSDGTYLITGGLGALGLQTAQWLVSRGAKSLVLAGRRGPSELATGEIEKLRAQGAAVETRVVDIADENAVRAMVDTIPLLRGVVHAAGILEDRVLIDLDWESCTRVMAPKVTGARHLDRTISGKAVDFFILYSSVASVIGSAGQGSYAAANAFLDALAHDRRRRGLPGLSVNWGAWADLGMAANLDFMQKSRWARSGMRALQPAQAFAALDAALDGTASQAAVMMLRWDEYLRETNSRSDMVFFSSFGQKQAAELSSGDIVARLKSAPVNSRRGVLLLYLKEHARHVLGLSTDHAVDNRRPLHELGLDSLMSVEFRNALAQDIGKPLSATLLFDHPSVEDLADYLFAKVLAGYGAGDSKDAAARELAAMSEAEAEMLLIRELEAGVN